MSHAQSASRYLVVGDNPHDIRVALEAHSLTPVRAISDSQAFDEEVFVAPMQAGVLCDASAVSAFALSHWPAMPLVLIGDANELDAEDFADAGLLLRISHAEAATVGPRLEIFMAELIGNGHKLVAADEQTTGLARLARRVADSDATVMLQGESGTGKEVFARFLHRHSSRADAPFVAINCAAIPEPMLEAMLFGHEKGAFTDASSSHAGKFEQANGGTLLLDEISEMSLGLQAKLLRVLQEREVERLGGHETIKLDVRVIATTNRNLTEAVASETFRRDLFYRLSVFPINLPPLRDRLDDVVPLALRLAWKHSLGRAPRRLGSATLRHLREHDWPGNVRELDNVIQRAIVLSESTDIAEEAIRVERMVEQDEERNTRLECLDSWMRRREHQLIATTLQTHLGNRKETARQLGISPRTLRYKLAQMRDAGIAVPA